jgi:type II secretory pathway component PulK
MTASSTSPERGFVLPVVLFVLAGLALILTASVRSFDLVAQELFEEQQRLRQDIEIRTATARVGYLLATQPRRQGHLAVGEELIDPAAAFLASRGAGADFLGTARFLEDGTTPQRLRLDGTPYLMAIEGQRFVVTVQDASGLLNPNIMTRDEVVRLLRAEDVPPGEAESLAAALLDYVDFDDEPRFGGRERFGYPEGRAPLNGPLPSRVALFDVPGWERLPPDVRDRLLDAVLPAGRTPKRNVNTGSAAMLAAIYGLEEGAIDAALSEREKQPFKSLGDMSQRIGAPVEGDPFVIHTAPSSLYRLRIESLGGGPVHEAVIDLDTVNGKPVTIRPLGDWEGRNVGGPNRTDGELEGFPAPPDNFAVRGWEPR